MKSRRLRPWPWRWPWGRLGAIDYPTEAHVLALTSRSVSPVGVLLPVEIGVGHERWCG